MAEKVNIELEIKDNVKSLKAQLREAQNEVTQLSEKFGATSREAVQAAKRAAELKDAIADAKDLTDAFNPDAKFNALSNSIGGVLNGFQAYEGALGLIGVESEDLQQTLLKVQSAMALSQGIQGALEAKDSFVQLGAVVKNVFAGMTNASKAFAVTGIGLLLLGLQQLATNWEKISQALGAATDEQRLNNRVLKESLESIGKELNAADKLSNSLKDETLSRKEKVKLIKQFQADYPGLLKNINIEKDSIEDINKQLTDNIQLLKLQAEAKALASIREETYTKKSKLQLQLQQEALENASNWTITYGESAENGFLGFNTASENATRAAKKFTDIQNESTLSLDKQIKSINESEKAIQKKIDALKKAGARTGELTAEEQRAEELAKQRAERQKEREKELRELRIAARREGYINEQNAFNEFISQQEATENEYLNKLKTNQELEVQAVTDKYFELLLRAKQYKQDTTLLEKARQKELDDINKKYLDKQNQDLKDAQQKQLDDKETFDELYRQNTTSAKQLEIDAVNEKYFYLIQQAKQYHYDIKELEKRRAAELAIIDASIYQHKEELRQNDIDMAIQAIGILRGVFEKDKNFQKAAIIAESALGVAKIIINTQAANAAALLTPQAIATSGAAAVPVIARNNISAGIGIAANIASTAKALQALGGGSAPPPPSPPPPAGGGANGTSTPANFNIVGNAGANPLAGLNQPIQAYVVSGQITSAQELDRKQISYSSFP